MKKQDLKPTKEVLDQIESPELQGDQENPADLATTEQSTLNNEETPGEPAEAEISEEPETIADDTVTTEDGEELNFEDFVSGSAIAPAAKLSRAMKQVLQSEDPETKIKAIEATKLAFAKAAVRDLASKYEERVQLHEGKLGELTKSLEEANQILASYKTLGSPESLSAAVQAVLSLEANPEQFREGIKAYDAQHNTGIYKKVFGGTATVAAITADLDAVISNHIAENEQDIWYALNLESDEDKVVGKKFIKTLASVSQDLVSQAVSPLMAKIQELETKMASNQTQPAPETQEEPEPQESNKDVQWQKWSDSTLSFMEGAIRARAPKDAAARQALEEKVITRLKFDPEYNRALDSRDTAKVQEQFLTTLETITAPVKKPVNTTVPRSVATSPEQAAAPKLTGDRITDNILLQQYKKAQNSKF